MIVSLADITYYDIRQTKEHQELRLMHIRSLGVDIEGKDRKQEMMNERMDIEGKTESKRSRMSEWILNDRHIQKRESGLE